MIMIDMCQGDNTCILSTIEFICNLGSMHNISPVVTFDQPLFWKTSQIVIEVEYNIPVKSVVLLLCVFHTLMNLLGAIGTLMEGRGYTRGNVFGKCCVTHSDWKGCSARLLWTPSS